MNDSNFRPPTPEQIERWLDRHPLRPPSPMVAWAPLMVLGVLLAVVVLVGGVWGAVLPWLGLAGVLGYVLLRVRRAKQLDQRVTQAQELAMLRHHEKALAKGWRLLPAVGVSPGLYVRTMTLLAHCLEELRAYEAAIPCFDRVLELLPGDHPGAVHLRIRRAVAALEAERLLDADEALRQLRGTVRQHADTPVASLYRLAALIQSVRTGHYDDPLEEAETLLDELRPLGVEAGYGHALLALCYHLARRGAGREEGEAAADDRRRQARLWWRRATTLLPVAALVERFPELSAMEGQPT